MTETELANYLLALEATGCRLYNPPTKEMTVVTE